MNFNNEPTKLDFTGPLPWSPFSKLEFTPRDRVSEIEWDTANSHNRSGRFEDHNPHNTHDPQPPNPSAQDPKHPAHPDTPEPNAPEAPSTIKHPQLLGPADLSGPSAPQRQHSPDPQTLSPSAPKPRGVLKSTLNSGFESNQSTLTPRRLRVANTTLRTSTTPGLKSLVRPGSPKGLGNDGAERPRPKPKTLTLNLEEARSSILTPREDIGNQDPRSQALGAEHLRVLGRADNLLGPQIRNPEDLNPKPKTPVRPAPQELDSTVEVWDPQILTERFQHTFRSLDLSPSTPNPQKAEDLSPWQHPAPQHLSPSNLQPPGSSALKPLSPFFQTLIDDSDPSQPTRRVKQSEGLSGRLWLEPEPQQEVKGSGPQGLRGQGASLGARLRSQWAERMRGQGVEGLKC